MAEETAPTQPTDPLETARAAQTLLAEIEAVFEAVKAKVTEVDAKVATFTELIVSAQTKASEINDTATAVNAAKTAITDAQAVIAAKSEHIQGAQDHADKVRADLDANKTAAIASATEAEGLRGRAETAMENITEVVAAITANKTTTQSELAVIVAAREGAMASATATKALADKSATIEERIAEYEKRLAGFEEQSKDQLATITRLLPGATSAGLATAFNIRRETFVTPARIWQWAFVLSLVVLIGLAVQGLWNVYISGVIPEWNELGRLWAARLPIAAALIWLALHASHESALVKRLEEDYGFKATTAASFQGFQKQMTEIGASATPDSPLANLCKDTLETIGSSPGRIYDKHQLTARPWDQLTSNIKELGSTLKQVAETVKPKS